MRRGVVISHGWENATFFAQSARGFNMLSREVCGRWLHRGAFVHRSRQGMVLCALGALAAAPTGCTKSSMQFTFAAIDGGSKSADPPHLDFYRLKVKASSGNARSDLQTGYYKASALHQLFGQVNSDDASVKNGSNNRAGQVVVRFDPVTHKYEIVEQDDRFAIVFGTNADALSQQISAFADSEQAGQAMASLFAAAIGRSDFEALNSAQLSAEEKTKAASALADQLDALAKNLDDIWAKKESNGNPSPAMPDTQKLLREALADALRGAGSGAVLSTDPKTAANEAKGAYGTLANSK
jgi:hypothetical protein